MDINSLAWTSSLHDSHRSRGLVVSAVNLLFNHELILSGLESSDIKQISGTLGTDSLSATSDVSAVRLASGRWRSSLRCTDKSSWRTSQGNETVRFMKTVENLWLSQLTSNRNQQSHEAEAKRGKTLKPPPNLGKNMQQRPNARKHRKIRPKRGDKPWSQG